MRKGRAACDLTGGIGYVPVTFNGLKDYRGFELLVDGQPLNQAVQGNDFWQTDYDASAGRWRLTYNLLRDGQGPAGWNCARASKLKSVLSSVQGEAICHPCDGRSSGCHW